LGLSPHFYYLICIPFVSFWHSEQASASAGEI